MTEEVLKPYVPDFTTVKAKEEKQRRKQKKVFDFQHSTHELKLGPLLPGEQAWVYVVEPVASRSYRVLILIGVIRRNHTNLR